MPTFAVAPHIKSSGMNTERLQNRAVRLRVKSIGMQKNEAQRLRRVAKMQNR